MHHQGFFGTPFMRSTRQKQTRTYSFLGGIGTRRGFPPRLIRSTCGFTTPSRSRATRSTLPKVTSTISRASLSSPTTLPLNSLPRSVPCSPSCVLATGSPRPKGLKSRNPESSIPHQARPKLIATGNGLAEHLLRDGENRHEVLLYASWPSSGLEEVLKEWPGIRR
jgi:hypothetical protein